ncbi:hypothetical protein CLM71_08820 [Serratia sp. MYb239]|uniref:hypothetical protein n=1 Tax=Serratia sp. MYb239 TaxID=2033438 RepID=UPI000CF74636|nr:hypothetical protein [Serratia sp. MYb239]AVJ17225.1 hypothetical protein CLM71_08820 [Serratia sp. MYb239]SQJ21733.1 Uncharacterised protein [Serratia rubidaea]
MPLYIDQSADYDVKYPPAFPVMSMNDPASFGTYSMASRRDFSGRGNDLITAASFNTQGMVGTKVGSAAEIPVVEPDALTVVMAINLPANPAEARNIISTLSPAVAPWVGFRLTQGTNGVGTIRVATGVTDPASTTGLDIGGITGGWTAFAFTISDSKIAFLRGSGANGTADITAGRAKSGNTIFLNGAPAGSQITDGADGTYGGVAVYEREMTLQEMAAQINNMRVFMATKGVVVP